MNEPWWKSQTMWASGGAALASLAIVALTSAQVESVDKVAGDIAVVAGLVAVAAGAFRAVIAKRR